jgi:hypothetical protein
VKVAVVRVSHGVSFGVYGGVGKAVALLLFRFIALAPRDCSGVLRLRPRFGRPWNLADVGSVGDGRLGIGIFEATVCCATEVFCFFVLDV